MPKAVFLEAKEIYRSKGDKEGEETILTGLSESMRGEGNVAATIPILRRAVELGLEGGSAGAGYAMTNLGISLRESGSYHDAVEVLMTALAVHEANGARQAMASTLGQLGTALGQDGHPEQAVMVLEKGLTIAKAIGDTLLVGMLLMNIANLHIQLGNAGQAETMYKAALDHFASREDRWHEGTVLLNLMVLHTNMGNRRRADEYMRRLVKMGAVGQEILSKARRSSRG